MMTDTSLRFKAFPGEQNDVKVTPGFLTFLRDASDVSLIPSPGSLAFSTNWLAGVTLSLGPIGFPLFPFVLPQSGVYVPSITGGIDSLTPTNFASTIASGYTAHGSSVVSGIEASATGDVFFKVTGGASAVIDDYELYQVVANPSNTMTDDLAQLLGIANSDIFNTTPGKIITGTVNPLATDVFEFHAQLGRRYVVMLDANPDNDNKITSTSIKISTDDPGVLAFTPEQNYSVSAYNALGAIEITEEGDYKITVENTGVGSDTDYRLVLLEVSPFNEEFEISPNDS
ncbi:MAG: hypothetical protein KDA36_09915, partial [Planctomycetaceae bacterium]|nr:hypothetical protein [Planctomycetaceae bacterium]